MNSEIKTLLRGIPAISELQLNPAVQELIKRHGSKLVKHQLERTVRLLREEILAGRLLSIDDVTPDHLIRRLRKNLEQYLRSETVRVINATGVVLHTNLGRAPLAEDCVDRLSEVAANYSNLEYSLERGCRGHRESHAEKLLCQITGAEAAHIVNNNAAAVMLVLNTFCQGREVIISRGELVEVGGSFRIPDIMQHSNSCLHEVGATNRTRLSDYERAINDKTAAIIKVHTSNYQIVGFTESVDVANLRELCKEQNLYLFNDLGSGLFIDLRRFGLPYEPTVQENLAAGCDLVMFSGDKLLGGTQAGIVLGRKELIDQLKHNQLSRALRIDKLTLVALEQTLNLYLDEEVAIDKIPILSMLNLSVAELTARAQKLSSLIQAAQLACSIDIVNGSGKIGGGAFATAELATVMLKLKPVDRTLSANKFEQLLRHRHRPIIVRIVDESIVLDLRTIRIDEFGEIVAALEEILSVNTSI